MFGSNYDRLYKLKKTYDPTGLFWATPSVGADDYVLVNGRLCEVKAGSLRAESLKQPPITDNTNVVAGGGSGYSAFPESQAQADQEAPKLAHW
jgi:hypothetical protein